MTNQKTAWKFLANDRRLQYGDGRLVEVGKTLTVEGRPILCTRTIDGSANGIHYAERAIDALYYAPGLHVALVRPGGEIDAEEGGDKACCTALTPLAIGDATDAVVGWALWCADQAVRRYAADTLEAAGLTNEATKLRNLPEIVDETAADAARNAARNAADAARNAAWSAARNAAWSAADAAWSAADAAWSAADAARNAAWSAAEDEMNAELERLLCTCFESPVLMESAT